MVSKENGGCQPQDDWLENTCRPQAGYFGILKGPLTIKEFHEANEARRRASSSTGGGTESTWNLADWTNELCGEAGELANLAKKIRRARPAQNGKKADPTLEEAKGDLAAEIADVVICASLVAGYLGIDLEQAMREKFNVVSDRMGSDIKL